MKRKEFLRLKAGLLCSGMKLTPDAKEELSKEYPHFFVKGFVHATNMSIFGSNLCVSVADGYSSEVNRTIDSLISEIEALGVSIEKIYDNILEFKLLKK